MKREELEAIRKRSEAATPGPWYWDKFNLDEDDYDTEMPYLNSEKDSIMDFGDGEQFYPTEGTPPNEADAEFIAHAREDVPKLLAEIERLKTVSNDILEEYDSSERRVIDEVSTDRKFALHMHEAYLRSCKNEINGVDEE
jgi:hypothetical protein